MEARLQRLLVAAAREGLFASAHDCAEGGLAVALSECCILGARGARVKLPAGVAADAAGLFGEDPTRVVVSYTPYVAELVRLKAEAAGVALTPLGVVDGASLVIEGVLDLPVPELSARHAAALDPVTGNR